MYFTTTTLTAALLASTATLALARTHEHPSICSVSYAKHPSKLSAIKSCCKEVNGTPQVNTAHKTATCSGSKFTLESFEQTEFYNCVLIGQGLDVSCKAIAPVVPRSTATANCNVGYGRSRTNQRYVASCCTEQGGKAANHASLTSEKCSGLKGSHINNFKSCVEQRKLKPSCTAIPTAAKPAPTPKQTVTSTAVAFVTQVSTISIPHVGLATSTVTPTTVQPQSEPTASVAPVNTDSSCQAMYMGDVTVQAKIQNCCTAAKGTVFLEAASQTVVCNGLDTSSANNEVTSFTDCVGADVPVICAL